MARPSVRIELEELDEPLDANFFAPVPESSEELLQRAIDGVKQKMRKRTVGVERITPRHAASAQLGEPSR